MDADEEKITGILRRLTSHAQVRDNRAGCPDEETLAVFLNDSLEDAAKTLVETHLANCPLCVAELVAAYQSGALAGIQTVPQRLIDNVIGFVQRRETVFDLVVRLVKGSIELISTSGRVIPAPSAALRGEAKPVAANSLQVAQEVGRFRVAVELDLSEAGMCQVIANVGDDTGEPAEGVRLSLSSGEREQASFLTRHGLVVFDRIAPGEYSITVSESGGVVGRIRLSLIL